MKETLPGIIKETLKEQTTPSPPEKKPEDYTAEDTCKTGGFHWYDGACHKETKIEEPAAVVEARKALFTSETKVTETERKLKEAKELRVSDLMEIARHLEDITPSDLGSRSLMLRESSGFTRLVEGVKRTKREVEEKLGTN